MRKLLCAFLLLGVAACSTVPESVQVPPDTNLVTYKAYAMAPESNEGAVARWGGVVAHIENQAESTMLEVVHYPLRSYGRPIIKRESIGRFRVYIDGFLDPMVYQKGRMMTFAGELAGVEDGLVGEHQYRFPTLKAGGYYLWEDIERIEIEHISLWPYGYGRYGWPHRGWYGWGAWPYHQRVILRRKHDYYRDYSRGTRNSQSQESQGASNQASGNNNPQSRSEARESLRDEMRNIRQGERKDP